MSLGRPGIHDLAGKLEQAAQHGFEGIELFYDDLEHFARKLSGTSSSSASSNININSNSNSTPPRNALLSAAYEIRKLCDSLNLSIVCLQPFSFYEGLLDRAQHDRLLHEKLPLWLEIARILGTNTIQVPSNFLPADQTTGDRDVIVSDLRELADRGLQEHPPVRFAYEALAWGTHIDTWEASWEIVQRVNRPNFGLCLDTFNIAGRVYADPTSVTGKTPTAETDLAASLARLRGTVDPRRVFFVQVVDGERLHSPLLPGHKFHVLGQPARMSWSRNARLFAGEEHRGGYLPVFEVARAFFDVGFDGWVSMELFSRTLADPDPRTPAEHARRGIESWRTLRRRVSKLGAEQRGGGSSSNL